MAYPYKLESKLSLETVVLSEDLTGGFEKTWVELGVIWGHVEARSGRIREARAGELSRMQFRIIVRAAPFSSGARPKAGQRFRDANRLYSIEAVALADASGLYLECWASEEQLT
jgi:head-tail adaptor